MYCPYLYCPVFVCFPEAEAISGFRFLRPSIAFFGSSFDTKITKIFLNDSYANVQIIRNADFVLRVNSNSKMILFR